MPQLTKAETVKVLSMYLGCQCTEPYSGKPIGVLNSVHAHGYIGVLHKTLWDNLDADKVKLFLTPLQSISDEDCVVVAQIFKFTNVSQYKQLGKSLIYQLYTLKDYDFDIQNEDAISIFQYLISKGYDCPLWFGIDHWANGKTAIELNLAIAKTN